MVVVVADQEEEAEALLGWESVRDGVLYGSLRYLRLRVGGLGARRERNLSA